MISLVKNIKGIMLCVLLAIPAWIIGSRIPIVGSPVFGIIFGMIMTIVIKNKKDIQDGIKFTSKNILQFAVILLGFGMNFSDILKQGKDSLPVILSSITVVLLVAFTLSKLMKLKGNIPTLIGVGSAICGGSAIAATAPVIMAEDEEIAQSISVIFLFNIIAAIVFPTLGGIIGLSNEGFGMFAGTAINDTSSVTAATASWDGMYGGNALDMATIVKLTRTLAIVPITLVLSFWTARQERSENNNFKLKKVFPRFILFFYWQL